MSNPEGLARALELIEKEKREKTGFLNLADCGLTNVPEELRELTWLTNLVMGGMHTAQDGQWAGQFDTETNALDKLPDWLGELQCLQKLWISGSFDHCWEIKDISQIAELPNLNTIYFCYTKVSSLFPLQKLSTLETLGCFGTLVADLTPLMRLLKLKNIYVSGTCISSLSALSGLKKLRSLNCGETQVSDLLPLSKLSSLQEILLYGTQVKDLSPIAGLKKLKKIECGDTQISDLTPLASKIANGFPVLWNEFNLKKPGIVVRNCPLICPPVEFAIEGPEAVVEYFEQLGDDRTLLNEIKIIFLGEGASGKTSLIKQLRGESFDPNESQTHGIRIRKTPFDLADGATVTAHLWDFGGQEVMHATHQFFLSQRCVYVLVLDSRKDDKAEYWLKHAQSFGGDSPVLVVLNKIDENPSFQVNGKGLKDKYPQVREFFRLSCNRGDGLEAFRAALAAEIADAPARRTPFPAAWLAVKEHFADLVKDYDYIDSAAYEQVCQNHGVDRKFSQGVLLQFLHDLGVVINFRNLRNFDTQILNPLWLTNGVYRIVNSELVANQGGLLHERDFDAVINNPKLAPGNTTEREFHYPPSKLHYIVRVMEEFELCYPLDSRRYIVPQLLPVEEPDFETAGAVLHFVIRFPDFLPDSIFPRLMVKLHPFIKGELRWRTGMVLEKRSVFDATARIRADKEDREIRVDVCGAAPRRFLSYIRATVKEIVADFANLAYSEWVPIPDSGEFLEYESLVAAESAKEKEIFVWQVKKRIPVAYLLDGVEEPAMRDELAQTPVKAFVSYSHKDGAFTDRHGELRDFVAELRAALSPSVRLEKLRLWDDRAIDAGAEWYETIFRELNEADLVLCLVSQDFINSDFCYTKELAAALHAHGRGEKTVVPIRLRECDWEDLQLAKLQGTPGRWIGSAGNKDAAWTEVARSLKPAIDQAKARKARR